MQKHKVNKKFIRSIFLIQLFSFLSLIGSPSSWSEEQKQDVLGGKKEYEIACLPCHGLDGKGDGPQAKTLSLMPADLTRIAKSRNGQFPEREIYDLIDGRGVIPAHGKKDMPIWGLRYRTTSVHKDNQLATDQRVRRQIESLVQYLKTIQQMD
ncbi:MAG: c-type cytochrome [Hyphomicrobium sp.]